MKRDKLTSRQKAMLTPRQKAMLCAEMQAGDYVLLQSTADDTVARALQNKGYGVFVNFKWQYSWRTRSGYYNHFQLNETGLQKRKELTRSK